MGNSIPINNKLTNLNVHNLLECANYFNYIVFYLVESGAFINCDKRNRKWEISKGFEGTNGVR